MKLYSSKQRFLSLVSCGVVLLNIGYGVNNLGKDVYYKPTFTLETNQKVLRKIK